MGQIKQKETQNSTLKSDPLYHKGYRGKWASQNWDTLGTKRVMGVCGWVLTPLPIRVESCAPQEQSVDFIIEFGTLTLLWSSVG